MEWYFRDISDDPSEKELTQQDQFNNDEVALAEALVRETIQNSTDARVATDQPVRVRFALCNSDSKQSRDFFDRLVTGLKPHLDACRITVPGEVHRFLVVEDFNTTGLKGSIELKDDGQFCGFWRRFGRSNKKGASGGRWGLGKLVFSSSSSIRVLIGLTRRGDSPDVCLMGQAILRNHAVDGVEADSVGFWCRSDTKKKGLPSIDRKFCAGVASAAKLTRQDETGLSLIIPYVLPDIESAHLIAAAIKNYYFPILTKSLIVTVDDTTIDATTFDTVSAGLGGDAISASTLSFVRSLQAMEGLQPTTTLPPDWQSSPITGEMLGDERTLSLRQAYQNGEMVRIRAPLKVEPKDPDARGSATYVDLYLKAAGVGERSQTLVVRGSITIPGEGRKAHLLDCHAAIVARDSLISQLLGDAENPAHTLWNERAEKLKANWSGSHLVLRRIRAVLHEIHGLLVDRVEREDLTALLDFFSIPKQKVPAGSKGQGVRTDRIPQPRPKPFRIDRRSGGFSVVPNTSFKPESLPIKIRLRCAYDVLNGNPFKRFSEDDFSFYKASISIDKQNADCWPVEPNELDVEARSEEFRIDVLGFDPNRDLIVEAES